MVVLNTLKLSHDKRLEVKDNAQTTKSDFEQHYPNLSESIKVERNLVNK